MEDVLFNRRPDSTERLVEFAEQVKGRPRARPRKTIGETKPLNNGCPMH